MSNFALKEPFKLMLFFGDKNCVFQDASLNHCEHKWLLLTKHCYSNFLVAMAVPFSYVVCKCMEK